MSTDLNAKTIEQVKAMNLDKTAERKVLKALGVVIDAERFERSDYTVNNPGNANHGKTFNLIAINKGKQSKTITLWQAEAIIEDLDGFILFVEELKAELAKEKKT